MRFQSDHRYGYGIAVRGKNRLAIGRLVQIKNNIAKTGDFS